VLTTAAPSLSYRADRRREYEKGAGSTGSGPTSRAGGGSNALAERLVAVLKPPIPTPAAERPFVHPESRVFLADHVVYRQMPHQTVVLNLETGRYHGLSPMSGRMLASLDGRTVASAARSVADRYGHSPAKIERDLCELCARLRDRGVIRVFGRHGE
jgi:Coenzyme PQQ synthesis protein D (PqqD)